MLINDSNLQATHQELSKKRALNKIFDGFCLLAFSFRKEIELNPLTSPEKIYRELELYLKNNMLLSHAQHKSIIDESIGEALYAMCALADELFLIYPWEGRGFWERHMLESAFFNTHISGEEIFRRIDVLLEEGNAIYSDLGEIYLKMLALGFTGKYIGMSIDNEIDEYRSKLYRYITHSDHTTVIKNNRLFDEEYANTMIAVNRKLLPDPKLWNRAIAMYLFMFTIIGMLLWHISLSDVFNRISEIEEITIHGASV